MLLLNFRAMKSKILILLFFLSVTAYSEDDFRILSSDQNSILIEYTPVYLDTSSKVIDNRKFINVVLKFGYMPEPELWGLPAIPDRRFNVGVPSEFGNTIEVLNTKHMELQGAIVPKPQFVKDGELQYKIKKEGQTKEEFEEYNPRIVMKRDGKKYLYTKKGELVEYSGNFGPGEAGDVLEHHGGLARLYRQILGGNFDPGSGEALFS